GLMEGDDGNFRPRDSMTRQEAAVMMNRVWTRSDWSNRLRSSPPANIQLGWQYGQTTSQFERQVEKSNVNTLSPRWFFLGDSGELENGVDPSLIAWAHRNGKKVWAMVGNHSDSVNTHAMLADSSLRLAFIRNLSAQVKQYGIDGLNIDFENMLPEDRDAFTTFASELHAAMANVSAVLSINVSPDFGTDWTEVFDYAALGDNAEYVVLMGYDEHWGGSQIPGSVSSLPWLRQGLESLLSKVPSRKVILALPLYTRQWAMDPNGRVASLDRSLVQQNETINVHKLVPVWDDSLGQYYAQFSESSSLIRIWLEDGRSLAMKMTLGESYSLAGYGYWYMGGESADVWTSLRNAMKFSSYTFG
ncbi:MAG: glycoside hydrolase, partial [Cohnella sp.]|nr:glycoside hydrolase [Cohnella sp.]